MAEGAEPEKYILTDDDRQDAEITMTMLALRLLIGEVARLDRDAAEAQKFVLDFRSSMIDFVENIRSKNNPVDTAWAAEMQSFTHIVTSGIDFADKSK